MIKYDTESVRFDMKTNLQVNYSGSNLQEFKSLDVRLQYDQRQIHKSQDYNRIPADIHDQLFCYY